MWFGLILIMIAVPLLELALLIKLGQSIGFWPTIGVIFGTAAAGIAIMNAQGLAAFRRASASLAEGKPPVEPVLDGFMLMLAGGLLLAPGLLTDAAGLLLLIPPVRRAVASWGIARMAASGNIHVSTWSQQTTYEDVQPRSKSMNSGPRPGTRRAEAEGPVIEGEFERVDEKPTTPRRDDSPPPGRYRNGHAKEP
jgi:UPF0716 protein FxsA